MNTHLWLQPGEKGYYPGVTTLLIGITSLIASALTLFSGFGLGTLLMPVAAIFFPVEVAISITALVHLANNLFKALLVGRHASSSILLRFGAPAVLASLLGAFVLVKLGAMPPLYEATLFGTTRPVTPVKGTAGFLILIFVLLELVPAFTRLTFPPRYLPLGGVLSGFFGGLSGHQGALRTMFLVKAGLSKESFIGTGVLIAVLVDIARLSVYGWSTSVTQIAEPFTVVVACVCAFIGAFVGARLIQKVTYRAIQILVSAMLSAISFALLLGII